MSSKINIHNLFHILHHFWIHNTKNWILKLLSKQFAHLQMAMKHCTKFQVSLISHKGEEVSISYFILSVPFASKKSNWILLSQNYAHLQMTMKHGTKSSKRRSEHQLFNILQPYGSNTIQKNIWILPFLLYEHLQMTIYYKTKFQVSPIGHLGKEVSTRYFTPSTPLGSTITQD
jgi:hypothetical protein